MKKIIGAILIGLGILAILQASLRVRNAPNVEYLIGTFLPGLLLLILGLVLRRGETSAADLDLQASRFKTIANICVGAGFVMMAVGGGLARQGEDLLVAIAVSLAGWALLVVGCVNYMRWKGRSGWFGLFGYLLLHGLIVVACFHNRRARILSTSGPEDVTKMEVLSREDQRSGYQYLLTIVPLVVLYVGLSWSLASSQSNIDPAEWKEVDPAGNGFQALMPGTARVEQQTKETPAGDVTISKFKVEPKGKNELFLIVAIRFPEEVATQLGGREKLLELGREDLLAAAQGQPQNERPIVLGNLHGLELEVLPPKGASIKARIYATKNQVYQVTAHVPQIRLKSDDVQKFLESCELTAEP
jgi:hypothetical protein